MVLLPECIPILPEFLEDTVRLAQEYTGLSEELLRESLQDSLR